MDKIRLQFLFDQKGQQLLDQYGSMIITPDVVLKLSKQFPQLPIQAITEQLDLRQRARKKFSRADKMLFTRVGLEQASSETVSNHHAKRYKPFHLVADLCCGIGSDGIAIAKNNSVIAIDYDEIKLKIARWNARANSCDHSMSFVCADVNDWIPPVDAIFIDPDRRLNDKKIVSLHKMQPPITVLPELKKITPHIGIKISAAYHSLEIPPDCEIEAISLNGQCIEAVLWFGDLKSAPRRATILPANVTLAKSNQLFKISIQPPGNYLFDPDPAVSRVHLVNQLVSQLNGYKLDADNSLFCAGDNVATPFADKYQVLNHFPYQFSQLKSWLKENNVGKIHIIKRNITLDSEQLIQKLKGKGDKTKMLLFTQIKGKTWVFDVNRINTAE